MTQNQIAIGIAVPIVLFIVVWQWYRVKMLRQQREIFLTAYSSLMGSLRLITLAILLEWLAGVNQNKWDALSLGVFTQLGEWLKPEATSIKIGLGMILIVPSFIIFAGLVAERVFPVETDAEIKGRWRMSPIVALALIPLSCVSEELFFRGSLQSQYGPLVSAALFGVVHGLLTLSDLPYIIVSALTGLVLSTAVYLCGGNLWVAIIPHVANNAVAYLAEMLPMPELPKDDNRSASD